MWRTLSTSITKRSRTRNLICYMSLPYNLKHSANAGTIIFFLFYHNKGQLDSTPKSSKIAEISALNNNEKYVSWLRARWCSVLKQTWGEVYFFQCEAFFFKKAITQLCIRNTRMYLKWKSASIACIKLATELVSVLFFFQALYEKNKEEKKNNQGRSCVDS